MRTDGQLVMNLENIQMKALLCLNMLNSFLQDIRRILIFKLLVDIRYQISSEK